MKTIGLTRATLVAAVFSIVSAGLVFGQSSETDTKNPAGTSDDSSPWPMERMMRQIEKSFPGAAMMQGGMMGEGMMERAMEMHGPQMKIMFAIADTNGDGALSFDEVTVVHKRIFDSIDSNKDGKVTREEMQTFWRD